MHSIRRLLCSHRINKIIYRKSSELVADDTNFDPKAYMDFKKYLKNNTLRYKDQYACLKVECKLCTQPDKGNAYVNKRTGAVLCPSCDHKTSLPALMRIYEKKQEINGSIKFKAYTSRFQNPTDVSQSVCEMLKIHGLKEDHLKALGAKYDSDSNVLVFPLKNEANKIVGEKVLHLSDNSEETFQTSTTSGLLLFNFGRKSRAVLVTNLLDFIVLTMQRLDDLCVICLPYSLKSLPQECLPTLEGFKELILWFNFDSAGWDTAKTLSNKLDEKRCLLIKPTDTEPAPHVAYRKRFNFRHILHKATPVRHKSITTFNALKNDILSELQNVEKVNGVKWKRFPILMKLLKGHRKGELTILTGPTGSGKTTFMSEYSLDLALQGVSTLWGSFEIRNSRLASTLLRQFVGYSLENKLNEFEYWSNEFEKYPLYFMTFHGQQPLKVVMEAIEHAQYVHDINHVIIDNLQFMMGISLAHKTDKFWEQDAIIAAFREFATKRNVHVTLVMHPRKERQDDDLTTSSVFGTAKATQEADNVLIIQDKRLTSLRGKKYLQIVKNRYSGDLGIMPLEFDKESLSYANSNKRKKEKL